MSSAVSRTKKISGREDVSAATANFLTNASTHLDLCTTSFAASEASLVQALVKPFLEAGSRGIRLRLITSIRKEDVKLIESLSGAVEVRHIDNVSSCFGVSDSEYIAIPGSGAFSPEGPLLYSNEGPFVRSHQDLFETVWGVAMPAESRLKDLETGQIRTETRIVRGEEEVVRLVGSFLSRAVVSGQNSYAYGVSDADSTMRAADLHFDSVRRLFMEHPEFRVLHITDIQQANLESVKKLIKAGYEVRHLGGNTIRFSVSMHEYVETTHTKAPGRAPDEVVWSNDPQLVAQGKRIFDALWSHAVPSEVRIRAIEGGVSPETMKIIVSPAETQALYSALVGAAKYDILLLLPTSNAFHRDEKIGVMESLRAAAKRGVRISILSPVDETIEEQYPEFILRPSKEHGIQTEEGRTISLRRISQARVQNTVTILVVDGTSTLIMEEMEPSSMSFADALGFATYSTTSPTVRSSIRFFERMRDEADLRGGRSPLLKGRGRVDSRPNCSRTYSRMTSGTTTRSPSRTRRC